MVFSTDTICLLTRACFYHRLKDPPTPLSPLPPNQMNATHRKVQDPNMPLLQVRWLLATQRTELPNSQGQVPQRDDSTCKNGQLPTVFKI